MHLTLVKMTQHVVVKGVASLAGLRWLLDLTLCPVMNCGNSTKVKCIPQIKKYVEIQEKEDTGQVELEL